MRSSIKTATMLVCLCSLMAATSRAGDGVQVMVTNDGTEDILVTVYDMNAGPQQTVLQATRINGFTSVPISAVRDANGEANLAWIATTADAGSRKCGHGNASGITVDSSLSVHADSSCSA
ncbi:MAG TPA: hypothetical protein VGI65_05325 [Steroidobacteraceae bacterium]